MLTIFILLVVAALILAILSAFTKIPLWVAVLLIAIALLIDRLPLGK